MDLANPRRPDLLGLTVSCLNRARAAPGRIRPIGVFRLIFHNSAMQEFLNKSQPMDDLKSGQVAAASVGDSPKLDLVSLLRSDDLGLSPIDWTRKNVVNPIINASVVEAANAAANVVNAAARPIAGKDLVGKVGHLEVAPAEFLTGAWFAQSASSGLGAVVPYVLAGKVAGSSLRAAGSSLGLEGTASHLLQHRSTSAILGAAAFDFVRDTRANETRTGNAIAGAAAFSVFEAGNALTGNSAGLAKYVNRALVGGLGAATQLTVSRGIATGELASKEEYVQAAITGGVMNIVLPPMQNKVSEVADKVGGAIGDRVNIAVGRGISVERFRGQSKTLDELIDNNPRARVQPGSKFSDMDANANRVYLPGERGSAETLARELTRLKLNKAFGSVFDETSSLVKQGRVAEAWGQYRETRANQETIAHNTENYVAYELKRANSVIERVHLLNEIGAWPAPGGMSQERRWRFEFSDLLAKNGDFRPGMKVTAREAFDPDSVNPNKGTPLLRIEPGTPEYRYRQIADKAIADLQGLGAIAVNAGGSTRNELQGIVPKDYDIATSAKPDQVQKLFESQGHKVIEVGKQFGTIKVMIEGHVIEITTLRSEGNYTDGRHPDNVTFISSLREDAARRDLTMNAIFKDPLTNTYYDFFGGRKDIQNKVIRMVGDPDARIKEDPIRMMRIADFYSRDSRFTVDPLAVEAIKRNVDRMDLVKADRLRMQLGKIFETPKPSVGMQFMMDTGILHKILPELPPTDGPKGMQDPKYHPEGTTWTHQKMVGDNLAAAGYGKDFVLMLSGYTHDIGKPATQQIWPDGGISNYKHDTVGAEMTPAISKRFNLSNKDAQAYHDIVKYHMQAHDAQKMRPSTLWRFLQNPSIDQIIKLQDADARGTLFSGRAERSNKQFFENKLAELKNAEVPSQRIDAKPLVDGRVLIELGVPANGIRKDIIAAARLAQADNLFSTVEDGKIWVRNNFADHVSKQ